MTFNSHQVYYSYGIILQYLLILFSLIIVTGTGKPALVHIYILTFKSYKFQLNE